jgi:Na+-driven multidrug efflux pump
MGIAGVAIASAVAHVVAWAVLWANIFLRGLPGRFGLLSTWRPDWATARSLLQLSAPLILQYVIAMVAFFFFMGLIEKRGEVDLAVSNLMKSVYLTFMIPSWGLSSAVGTLVSRRIGEGHANAVLPLLWHVARLNLVLAFVLSTPLLVVPRAVLHLFTSDAAVVEAALPLLVVVVPSLWVYAVSNILLGALIGTGASRWSMATEVLNAVLYIAFLTGAAAVGSSLQVLWMCEWIYVLVIGLLPGWLLHRGRWRGVVV